MEILLEPHHTAHGRCNSQVHLLSCCPCFETVPENENMLSMEWKSNTYVLERFNTTAGNPVKKILLKLNLSDHRLFKDGGGVKEFQRSFRHSDTERLSRSDEVLKLKNFKKDATLKLFKSTNQVRYEHVGPTITSSQDGKVNKMAKMIFYGLVDDSRCFKTHITYMSRCKEQAQALNQIHYIMFNDKKKKKAASTRKKTFIVLIGF
ncbi:hypothetical protein Tco_0117559 [Tanacetum coccineum]